MMKLSGDDYLTEMVGGDIVSERSPGVRYRVSRLVGAGGMAVAFFALRFAPDGECASVLKVVRPDFVRSFGATAALTVQKEAVALGRLNEHVPPSPFVVRLLDTGCCELSVSGQVLELPWIALEYVHGGAAGTTLDERVAHSIRNSGSAFDVQRATVALRCLVGGLSAVHTAGVIHRDIKPSNVLCSGTGMNEVFKLADFGVARPTGMAATFGGILVGTPGYASPEQAALDVRRVGAWSDVFSLACVIYFMLTGEDYFVLDAPADALLVAREPARRSISESEALCPELRARPEIVKRIDRVLARATAPRPADRPQSAAEVGTLLAPLFQLEDPTLTRHRPTRARADAETTLAGWRWLRQHRPRQAMEISSASWDGPGRCLAVSRSALVFYDGTEWVTVPTPDSRELPPVRAVQRFAPGEWMLCGDESSIAIANHAGVSHVVKGSDATVRLTHASGSLDDLAVFVGKRPSGPAFLYAFTSGRWLDPVETTFDEVAGLAHVDAADWIVASRSGVLSRYKPLSSEIVEMDVDTRGRKFVSADGVPTEHVGVVVGIDGVAMVYSDGEWSQETLPDQPALSTVQLDAFGGVCVAGPGGIWQRGIDTSRVWLRLWEPDDVEDRAPVTSMMVDQGLILALLANGTIIEGVLGAASWREAAVRS